MLFSHHVCSSYGSLNHAGDFSLLQLKTEKQCQTRSSYAMLSACSASWYIAKDSFCLQAQTSPYLNTLFLLHVGRHFVTFGLTLGRPISPYGYPPYPFAQHDCLTCCACAYTACTCNCNGTRKQHDCLTCCAGPCAACACICNGTRKQLT